MLNQINHIVILFYIIVFYIYIRMCVSIFLFSNVCGWLCLHLQVSMPVISAVGTFNSKRENAYIYMYNICFCQLVCGCVAYAFIYIMKRRRNKKSN